MSENKQYQYLREYIQRDKPLKVRKKNVSKGDEFVAVFTPREGIVPTRKQKNIEYGKHTSGTTQFVRSPKPFKR